MVPKRLDKNSRLHRTLAEGCRPAWGQFGSLALPTMTLPIDSGRFEKLFQFIAKGLIWHHWQTILTDQHFADVWTLTKEGERLFDERLFCLNARSRVEVELGNGTFVYRGAQGVDCPQVTAWHVWVYGGVRVSGRGRGEEAGSSHINIVTGPQSAKRYAQLAAKYGWMQGRLPRHFLSSGGC